MRLPLFLLTVSSVWAAVLGRQPIPSVHFRSVDDNLGVPDRYVVTLKDGHTLAKHWKAIGHDLSVTGTDFKYMEAINSYAVTLEDEDVVHSGIRTDAEVEAVEMDQYITLSPVPKGKNTETDDTEDTPSVEKRWETGTYRNADYASSQISLGKKGDYSGRFPWEYRYMDEPKAGTGVDIYILDSGIKLDHPIFEGRASNFQNLKPTDRAPYCPNDDERMIDILGHGTHTAGIAGGRQEGAAPGANLISVKVRCLDSQIRYEHIKEAFSDIIGAHRRKKDNPPPGWKGSVINMSWGMKGFQGFESSVRTAHRVGIPMAVAAGNVNKDVYNSPDEATPCIYAKTICVAASDRNYQKASFSNFGKAVNVIAPGEDIDSASHRGGRKKESGTSAATPFVAGIMATFLSHEGPELWGDADLTYHRLESNMLKGIITGFNRETVNAFANNGINDPKRLSYQPYAGMPTRMPQGTCKMKLSQVWGCKSEEWDPTFFLHAKLTDPSGKVIYESPVDQSWPDGETVDREKPLRFQEDGMQYSMSLTWRQDDNNVAIDYGYDVNFLAVPGSDERDDEGGMCTVDSSDWNNNGPQNCPEGSSVRRSFTCDYACEGGGVALQYRKTHPYKVVEDGIKLRILTVGDSITVGVGAGHDWGYRRRLKENLSRNRVIFAGTETRGSDNENYYAAWNGETIQYISNHVGPSLEQRPNLILLAAGTNDMSSNTEKGAKEGNDPAGAVARLGAAIDKMVEKLPDAVILVSIIIPSSDNNNPSPVDGKTRMTRTPGFQKLIPGMVQKRFDAGKKVLAADFSTFGTDLLGDGIHPNGKGYDKMGDWWYSFIHQIPKHWLKSPAGDDPVRKPNHSNPDRDGAEIDPSKNGGLDKNIPAPSWGSTPVRTKSKDVVKAAYDDVRDGEKKGFACAVNPRWKETGKIVQGGVGSSGDFMYHTHWQQHGVDAHGIGRDGKNLRLHDMNGDGKAGKSDTLIHGHRPYLLGLNTTDSPQDYVWVDPKSGAIHAWLNNRPDGRWQQAGVDSDLIAVGVGPGKTIFLADLNGDRRDDYLVVDENTGSVRIWWNFGPNKDWKNGWKWIPGNEIAGGMKHVNLATLRFPDLNGDGRADYTYIGEGGSVRSFLNVGAPGGTSLEWVDLGGVAKGAVGDISKLVFADVNGDGRDDYLIWDSDAGLSGFLNRPSNREGVPFHVDQRKAKAIVGGIHRPHSEIRLADMDGDGKDDYVHVNSTGAISIWYNRGTTADHMQIDGIRFADIDGDGVDDYVWLHPETGAPTVYLNKGADPGVALGWFWKPVNDGNPIAGGGAPAKNVIFGDVDGDGKDDYIVLEPETGGFRVWLNKGPNDKNKWGWQWDEDGVRSPYNDVKPDEPRPRGGMRIADMNGDGIDDYVYLTDKGGMMIFTYYMYFGDRVWLRLKNAEADGIGQSPDEIQLVDINGDGKADYVWTRKFDGRTRVWFNNFPNSPRWREGGEIAGGVGTAGSNVRWGTLTSTGRADYLAVEPLTGAVAAWLNYCEKKAKRDEPVGFSVRSDGAIGGSGDDEFDSVVMTWSETDDQ